jgi:hypothetical protein
MGNRRAQQLHTDCGEGEAAHERGAELAGGFRCPAVSGALEDGRGKGDQHRKDPPGHGDESHRVDGNSQQVFEGQ